LRRNLWGHVMRTTIARRFRVNGVLVDLEAGCLTDASGQDVALRPKPFAVLRHLASNPNRVVSKDELIEAVWQGTAVGDDSLVQCIGDIRRALSDADQSVLRTIPKRGYRFVLPDQPTEAEPAGDRYPVSSVRSKLPHVFIAGIALAVLALAALVWPAHQPGSSRSGSLPSVAVLPFKSLSRAPSSVLLAAGLSEDVRSDLARFPEFEVLNQNTSDLVSATAGDPVDVGRALGASFVVDGSIQHDAGQLRITAALIDTQTGRALWTDRWDRPDRDLFAIQEEIAEAVANRTGNGAGLVQQAGRRVAHRRPPASLSAYELYLLGTEHLERISKPEIEEAIRLLERAVAIDPGLARAWVELYHAYCLSIRFGANDKERRHLADASARRAIELDPMDPEAHAVLAMSYGTNNQFERARREFAAALELAPNNAEILTFYIGWASTLGEAERGADLIERAIRLDPDFPYWANGLFGYAYFMTGRYQEAFDMLDRLASESLTRERWVMRAGSLAALGRKAEAEAVVRHALATMPDLTVEAMVNEPGFSTAEHQRFEFVMKLAGFPVCATEEHLQRLDDPVRLPECLNGTPKAAD
jgi:TolB-like protein/DNA-binding winged helix-turn-helix (wHTH) protein